MLLADEAVIGPARGDGRGDDALGRLVGFGDRVEAADAALLVTSRGCRKYGRIDLAGGVGEIVGECDEVGIRRRC